MTSVDLGMFGLDCFVSDKSSSSLELDSDLCIQEFESLLQDNNNRSRYITWFSSIKVSPEDIEWSLFTVKDFENLMSK